MKGFWDAKVIEDFRERILVDADSPLLACKAHVDRYTSTRTNLIHS